MIFLLYMYHKMKHISIRACDKSKLMLNIFCFQPYTCISQTGVWYKHMIEFHTQPKKDGCQSSSGGRFYDRLTYALYFYFRLD